MTDTVAHRSQASRCLTAAGVAAVLLAASGIGFRALEARYARMGDSAPIAPGTLGRLSLQIGDWKGKDVPMDERIVVATDTDDRVNRFYTRGGADPVSLFVAYGIRFRDLMPHRPEICYPGAGWTMDHTDLTEIITRDGVRLPCQIHHFRRGVLRDEQVVVLNYYVLDGQYGADVKMLRSRAWRLSNTSRYVAQVQIVCSATPSFEVAEGWAKDFAADSATAIRRVLTESVASVTPAGAP